jgi:alanine-synthesizing transaminase
MFSRLGSRLSGTKDPLYALRDRLVAQGLGIVDLVSGNVNDHGIVFPQPLLEEILVAAARKAQVYAPDSLGQRLAREAIGAYYGASGLDLEPGRILLTPGTSISYWYAFKLLADEGDEVLVPSPSYPLFDYIAQLAGIRLVPYRMVEEEGWTIDLDRLDSCVSTRTRAVVLISPHNPTGHVATAGEIAGLAEIARRHDLAILSDEVFGEFLLAPARLPRPMDTDAPLVLTLNGFSKMLALPGLKLGWLAVSGEEERVRRAMRTLELISDTFLPVNEVVQAAAPALVERSADFRAGYAAEVRARYRAAHGLLSGSPRMRWVEPQGGFYVALELCGVAQQAAAEALLYDGILVHPGSFYDIPRDHLVLSFVQEPALQADAYARLRRCVEKLGG